MSFFLRGSSFNYCFDLSTNSGCPYLLIVNILSYYKVTPKEYFFVISSSHLTWIFFIVTCTLSMTLVIMPLKYPCSYYYFPALAVFLAKSWIMESQKLMIYCLRCSIILWFLHSHKFWGNYVISSSKPSTSIYILLELKLFQGIVIFNIPNLEYLSLKGKLSFFIISFRSLTFFITTSPDQSPIFIFYALKSSTYSLRIGLNIFSIIFSNMLQIISYI